MGTWDRNGRPRCRKEIFRRRAGRLRRMKGSAMLEAMAVILVFLVMASVLFASGRALNRQTVRTLEKNVARDGALTAVRLLAQDIMEGNRPGEEMEPERKEEIWSCTGCAPMEGRRRPSPCSWRKRKKAAAVSRLHLR